MKKIIRNNRILIFALLTLFSTSALAHPGTDPVNRVPAQLRLSSVINNQPLFTLQLNSEDESENFEIRIQDSDGYTLYRENIKAGRFSKKFLFNTEELGDALLFVHIRSGKTGQTLSFEVHAAAALLGRVTAVREL